MWIKSQCWLNHSDKANAPISFAVVGTKVRLFARYLATMQDRRAQVQPNRFLSADEKLGCATDRGVFARNGMSFHHHSSWVAQHGLRRDKEEKNKRKMKDGIV